MIISFGSKQTKSVWDGERVPKWPIEIQKIGRRKLRMLHNSQNIADLRIPPSNRLEKLSGNLSAYYSIRINDQWRIIFQWDNGQASEVEIIDYH
ncbi:type II toxin-antitoxin system RelE/ParE family toxin [Catalinimonas niigatensis]|uniref:type II toxin-antitoxin system RelE/ParE family toxin n=1 Tax=Catalinimonas niigatensis TaxID=1397264 RepID=UPI0026653171|nr:type II toxin-antitoxin system RelE/ParE family toxin [Catalinimonas niigatensis]WPP47972.1 type II toxin-antitoxin system RelE/ParE family toxin [Catalinimonas niigatensis]